MLVDDPNIGARRVTLSDERPAPNKVRVVEQLDLQSRVVLNQKEQEAEKTISALKDLLETENNAKAELRSQVAALEVGMNSERLQAEVREKEEASRFAALQEALEKDQDTKERAAKAEEIARQEIIALKKSSKEAEEAACRKIAALENDRANLTGAMEKIEEANQRIAALTDALGKAEEAAQKRVKELEEALKNKVSHLDESLRKIAELEDSAPRGSSSSQMPAGLPINNTQLVDDQDSSECGNPEHPSTIDGIADEPDEALVSFPSI